MDGDQLVRFLRAVGYAAMFGAWVRTSWGNLPRWNRVVVVGWLAVVVALALYGLTVGR